MITVEINENQLNIRILSPISPPSIPVLFLEYDGITLVVDLLLSDKPYSINEIEINYMINICRIGKSK
jgi:hypothetical protein